MSATVFIHGAGGSAKNWLPLIEKLNFAKVPFLYELPGHGERNDFVTVNIDLAVRDFARFIDKNDLIQFNIISHSLGGLVAIKYALDFSTRVSKLVLIATAAKIIIHPSFLKQIYSGEYDIEFLMEGFSGNINEETKFAIIHDLSRLKFIDKLDDFMGIAQCNLTDQLPKLNISTLVIVGESDRIISPRRSRELSKMIPKSQLRIIPDSAHYPHLENLTQTANAINQFLASKDETNLCSK